MLVSQAHSLMLLHSNDDNVKHFTLLFKGGLFGKESDLLEYITYVHDHTDAWLQSFPVSLKSITAISKPKTALLKMLTIPCVMKEMGAQICFDVADKIADSYRRLIKSMSEQRSIGSAQARTVLVHNTKTVRTKSPKTLVLDDPITTSDGVHHEHASVRVHDNSHESLSSEGSSCSHTSEATSCKPSCDTTGGPARSKLMGGKFAALVRVVRDLSIMLDEVLSEA